MFTIASKYSCAVLDNILNFSVAVFVASSTSSANLVALKCILSKYLLTLDVAVPNASSVVLAASSAVYPIDSIFSLTSGSESHPKNDLILSHNQPTFSPIQPNTELKAFEILAHQPNLSPIFLTAVTNKIIPLIIAIIGHEFKATFNNTCAAAAAFVATTDAIKEALTDA